MAGCSKNFPAIVVSVSNVKNVLVLGSRCYLIKGTLLVFPQRETVFNSDGYILLSAYCVPGTLEYTVSIANS